MAVKEMALAFAIKGAIDSAFSTSAKTAAQNLRNMSSEANRLKSAIRETERAQKLLDTAFKGGGMSEKQYNEELKKMRENLKGYSAELSKVAQAKSAQAKADFNAPKSGGMMAGIAGAVGKINVAMAAVQPFVDKFKEMVTTAMDFESAMADVRKVVDFDTPQQFQEMNSDILELTKTLPMTAEDIAKIVAAGGQAGIAREDLLSFAESAAKMGVAFDITADQAGDMMAGWRTAFQMSQPEVVELADKINYLGNTTAASAPKISDVVSRIGPLGEVGGVASGQIAALGASMVAANVPSEVAATGIKNMILALTKGESATKSQAEAFQTLGFDATDMAARMQTDAQGAIMDVLQALKALPKEQQASVMNDLFGSESIGAISPLLTNLEGLQENFQKVGDASQYSGSMEAEFEARSKTTENSIKLLENAVQRTAINIGSLFLPAIQQIAGGLASAIDAVTQFVQTHQELLGTLGAVAGVVAVAVAAYQGFMMIGTIVAAFREFSLAARLAAAAQMALNVAMSLNPIGVVIAIIAALIAAIVYLWNTNEGFRNAVIAAWEEIKNTAEWAFNAAKDAISTAVESIYQTLVEWCEKIEERWNALKETLSHPIDAVVKFIKGGDNEAADASDVDVDSNAEGGIYNKGAFLTTFAENSPEAAIPIDNSARAASLWKQTGDMLGLTSGSSAPVIGSLSIPVTITGNVDQSTIPQIQSTIQDAVERAMKNIAWQKARVSYA